jgi:hypothetical protein
LDAATLRFLLHKRLSRPSENALGRSGDFAEGMDVMRVTRLNPIFGIFVAAAAYFFITTPVRAQSISPAEAQQIPTALYIYGYSLPKDTGPSILNGSCKPPAVKQAS